MRILNTVEFYHPHVGGAERVVQRVSEGLVRRGHQVVVATGWDAARRSDVHNGVEVVQFRVSGNLARGMAGEVLRYQSWLLDRPFDVVMNYAAQSWPTDAALPVLGRLAAARVLATCGFSGMHGARRPLYLLYFRMLRRHIRDYDGLIYHADRGADVSFGRRYATGDHAVIPNGVDGHEFAENTAGFRARYGIGARPLVLHVGNHHRVKGHRDLVALARRLRDVGAVLAVIGADPGGWGSCWRACAHAAGRTPEYVLFPAMPRADVVAALCEADLVVLTSRFEVAPLVLVEAMAAGVPFVSYDVGNARALAGGLIVHGLDAMAGAVRGLLQDAPRRRALGQIGLERQRRLFDWSVLVAHYESFFESLAAKRQTRVVVPVGS